jgi:hypothetical protein
MKKSIPREAQPVRPLPIRVRALDRSALERVSAGHNVVDPMAGFFQNFQPDTGASSGD